MPPPTGVVRGPLIPMRWSRNAWTVSSGSQLPVSSNAFCPARTSFQAIGAAVLGGRRIEDQLGGGPDVHAGAVALDERDDGLVGDDQEPVVAHADEICHPRDATGRGGGPPNSGGSGAGRTVASEIPTPARPSGPGRDDGRRRFTPDAAALPVWRRGGAETMMESPCSAPRGGSEDVHRRAELDTLDTDGAPGLEGAAGGDGTAGLPARHDGVSWCSSSPWAWAAPSSCWST